MKLSNKSQAILCFLMMFVFIYCNVTTTHTLSHVANIIGAWVAGFGCYYHGGVHLGVAEK